jgi:putative transposase
MPRPRRPQYLQGQYYHIYNRGANRQSIFYGKENYLFVLRRMREYSQDLHITLVAYCLLPNHYHWLVRQEGVEAAGRLPQAVFNSYTKALNNRNNRSGTLFQGPYRVIHVQDDDHLLHLCRYIHTNPVRHGIAADLTLWPYSNYLEWIEQRNGVLVDRGFIRAHFGSAEQYRQFVLEDLPAQQLPVELGQYLQAFE